MLSARGIGVRFGGVVALDAVDLDLDEGEIVGLIGPNGAGKTTLLDVLSGYRRPGDGAVRLDGRAVARWSPQRLARHGLARSFQGVRLFGSLTAQENLLAAALAAGVSARVARARTSTLLERFGLGTRADDRAAALPLGDERRLGVARVLATGARHLLLDEPAAGLNEVESAAFGAALRAVRDEDGCAILLVEHDVELVLGLADRVQVLRTGRTLVVGTPEQVRRDDAVLHAYLGRRADAGDR